MSKWINWDKVKESRKKQEYQNYKIFNTLDGIEKNISIKEIKKDILKTLDKNLEYHRIMSAGYNEPEKYFFDYGKIEANKRINKNFILANITNGEKLNKKSYIQFCKNFDIAISDYYKFVEDEKKLEEYLKKYYNKENNLK